MKKSNIAKLLILGAVLLSFAVFVSNRSEAGECGSFCYCNLSLVNHDNTWVKALGGYYTDGSVGGEDANCTLYWNGEMSGSSYGTSECSIEEDYSEPGQNQTVAFEGTADGYSSCYFEKNFDIDNDFNLIVCDNNIDDDGDGLIDLEDPGCIDRLDNDEFNDSSVPAQCDDGIDNDGDGKTDYHPNNAELHDPECCSKGDNDESSGNCSGGSGEGQATEVKVVVNSSMENAKWSVGGCPGSAANTNGITGDCGVTYTGSKSYGDFKGAGDYTLTVQNISGYTTLIDGETRTSLTKSVPENPGNTEYVIWNVEFVQACGVSLTPSTTNSAAGETVNVSWNNAGDESYNDDWIAVVRAGSGWSGGSPWAWWDGTSGVTPPASPAPANGSVGLTMPSGMTKVQFVYYLDGGFTECGRSATINLLPDDHALTLGCYDKSSGLWTKGPCRVPYGDMDRLAWQAPGAASCVTSGAWPAGSIPASGEDRVGPITSRGEYTATCSWPDNYSVSSTVVIEPENKTEPYVTLTCAAEGSATFTSGPCQVLTGKNVNLRWTSEEVLNCVAVNSENVPGWSGVKAVAGSGVAGPIAATTTFTITCEGEENDVTDSVTVTPMHSACGSGQCLLMPGPGEVACVNDNECGSGDSCVFTADPTRLVIPPTSASSTLSWSCANVEDCVIAPEVGSVNPNGSTPVSPDVTTKYTLSCSSIPDDSPVEREATIRVFRFEGGSLKEVLP